MKTKKLTEEQKNTMSYADVAYLTLQENGKKLQIQELFKTVISLMELPESYFESKIGDFFGLLSTDKRFIMLEKGFWDLKENHIVKVTIDEDEDEEEEIIDEEEDEMILEEDEENDEINYDDDAIDDDEEEDDLKDLVIMDESEDGEM